jgi:hypothetical protein
VDEHADDERHHKLSQDPPLSQSVSAFEGARVCSFAGCPLEEVKGCSTGWVSGMGPFGARGEIVPGDPRDPAGSR